MKKKLITLTAVVALFATAVVFAVDYESVTGNLRPDVKVTMDGEEQVYKNEGGAEVFPVIIDGTTYLPLRGIMENLGKDVDWDEETQTITVTSPEDAEVIIPPSPEEEPTDDTALIENEEENTDTGEETDEVSEDTEDTTDEIPEDEAPEGEIPENEV